MVGPLRAHELLALSQYFLRAFRNLSCLIIAVLPQFALLYYSVSRELFFPPTHPRGEIGGHPRAPVRGLRPLHPDRRHLLRA